VFVPLVMNLFLRLFSYALPLTYGIDALHGATHGEHTMFLGG